MAADTYNHHSYCNHVSLPSSLTSGTHHHNQEASVSELIDHGSISFGRFAPESLAWEKWSVFSHNRCQEELEKFKSPGLVAQKKAYFEEYYKKIRAMKKLQAEQQETNHSDLCQGKNSITEHVESSVYITKSKEEKNSNDAIQIYFSEDETIACQESSAEITQDKSAVSEEQTRNHNDNIIKRDVIKISSEEQTKNHNDNIIKREIKISSAINESEDFGNKVDQIPASSVKTCSKASQQDSLVSVKPNANKLRDHAPLLKAKGAVASARDKTKLDYRTKKDAAKPSAKQKPFHDKDSSGKPTKSHVLSERPPPKPARNIRSENLSSHRPPTKPQSSATLPPPSHRPPTKPRSSATLPRTSVPKDKPASSSSFKGGVAKANLSSKGFMNKVHNTSKQITATNGADNVGPGKRAPAGVARKSLESGSSFMVTRRGQSENQKPKVMSTNLSARNKSNQNLGSEFGLRNDVRGNQIKIAPWQSADLTHARKEPREKTPSWR